MREKERRREGEREYTSTLLNTHLPNHHGHCTIEVMQQKMYKACRHGNSLSILVKCHNPWHCDAATEQLGVVIGQYPRPMSHPLNCHGADTAKS